MSEYIGMIYGSSNHPVEVKKIRLKIWTLREEIEWVIKCLQEKSEKELTPEEIQEIKNKYIGHIKLPPTTMKELGIDNGNNEAESFSDQDGDDATEEASAQADDAKEPKDSSEESKEEEAQSANDNEANSTNSEIVTDENNIIFINRKRPDLAPERISDAVTMLSDVNMNIISCFSSERYLSGQSIILEFVVPTHFFVSAEVIECRNYNISSRIISESRPKYRLHAKFTFSRAGERTMLRRFLKSVEPEIPVEKKRKPKQDDSDSLDDLDDLGL